MVMSSLLVVVDLLGGSGLDWAGSLGSADSLADLLALLGGDRGLGGSLVGDLLGLDWGALLGDLLHNLLGLDWGVLLGRGSFLSNDFGYHDLI